MYRTVLVPPVRISPLNFAWVGSGEKKSRARYSSAAVRAPPIYAWARLRRLLRLHRETLTPCPSRCPSLRSVVASCAGERGEPSALIDITRREAQKRNRGARITRVGGNARWRQRNTSRSIRPEPSGIQSYSFTLPIIFSMRYRLRDIFGTSRYHATPAIGSWQIQWLAFGTALVPLGTIGP